MRNDVRGSGLAGTTNLALLAPVREGQLAPGFEPISYLGRLRRLLDAMHASRRNARESELRGSAFPDPIGRFGIISGFRYALVPPELVASRRWHLSLNVTFDGGWEPYMRVIYRDIGPLLDALLCHCEGYRGSRTVDFDSYCRWVRSAELDAGIFYTDSGAQLGDQRYLASVERLQRDIRDPAQAARAVACHAELDDQSALNEGLDRMLASLAVAPAAYLPLQLRTLKGLYRLTAYWSGDDGDILWRFAKLVLKGLEATLPALRNTPAFKPVLTFCADELAWFDRTESTATAEREPEWDPSRLQAALLEQGPKATHGAMVLLRVTHKAQAAAHLASLASRCAAPVADEEQVRLHVALTYAGMQALGVHPARLDRLPPEFRDGMEARAGTLGDLRSNHPDHWHRPLRYGVDPAREDRIDLAVVHVAVMLRLVDAHNPGHGLHPRLQPDLDALNAAGTGLVILAVEPTRSRTASGGREHFGFADGISQPTFVPSAQRFADLAIQPRSRRASAAYQQDVPPGELVLGFANSRGDKAGAPDELLGYGSFLVVRKLRQRLDHLERALHQYAPGNDTQSQAVRTDLRERMMGRRVDGTPLVTSHSAPLAGPTNDYDYRGADGLQCPFSAHARRANPRDGRPAMPRLLRRGMGYGPMVTEDTRADDRGTLFMAYCASIAEQFETVQGWLAGASSTGVASAQADPYLGVPRRGESRVFRWVDAQGQVQRAELGDQPFVELQWGLYLFVPSLDALSRLGCVYPDPDPGPDPDPDPVVAKTPPVGTLASADLEGWRERLEDRDNGRATWRAVRQQGGRVDAGPYGQLVGKADDVFKALADAKAQQVSVAGFGRLMDLSIGRNHLGMDPNDGHSTIGREVNAAVAAIDEASAFDMARQVARDVLDATIAAVNTPVAMRHPDDRLRVPVDLMTFADQVVGQLARSWFGLPDADQQHLAIGGRQPMPDAVVAPTLPPRCPGHIIGPSRMIFGAQPRAAIIAEGEDRGLKLRAAVLEGLQAGATGTVLADVRQRLDALAGKQQGAGRRAGAGTQAQQQQLADALTGLLLGFAPTVHGNFLTVMKNWIGGGALWTWQQDLAQAPHAVAAAQALAAAEDKAAAKRKTPARGKAAGPGASPAYQAAVHALRRPMLDTMQGDPVPPMVWRCPVGKGGPEIDGTKVVLGLASAIEDLGTAPSQEARRDALLFGGDYFAKKGTANWGLHGCPGAPMGLGVMLAMAAVLLEAGTLRPTGSPVLLILTPKLPLPVAPPAARVAPTPAPPATAA